MALIINNQTINAGEYLKKTDLDILFPQTLKGKVEMEDKDFLFITIHNKEYYQNELHHDGVVHQAKEEELADYIVENKKNGKPVHIFVRYFQEGQFLYLGELERVIRYDINRNKLIIKGTHK